MKGKLSELQLRRWSKAALPMSAKADGGGLCFRVHSSGASQFYFRYRYGGKARWLFLGNYPDLPLAEARKQATAARAALDKGIDIGAEKRRRKADAAAMQTVAELSEDWLRREIEPKVANHVVYRRVISNDVIPVMGRLGIKEVEPRHVDLVLRRILDRGAPTVANDALRYLKRMFGYGRRRHHLLTNPAEDFRLSDAGGHEKARSRVLSREEIIELFRALRSSKTLGRENDLTFRILLATCVRRNELVKAKWEEFDLARGVWHMPAARSKNGRAIDVPLAEPVVVWLKELKVFSAGSDYVLPARRIRSARSNKFGHISPDTLNVALGRIDHRNAHFTIHDLRRTARTQLSALGVPAEIAESALNHKIRGVAGVYDQHKYFDERREALARWAALLVACEEGRELKVVPIHRRPASR